MSCQKIPAQSSLQRHEPQLGTGVNISSEHLKKRARLDEPKILEKEPLADSDSALPSASVQGASPSSSPSPASPAIVLDGCLTPEQACCGVLFDLECSSVAGQVDLKAFHLTSWSRSARRPVVRVFCCTGPYAKALSKRQVWKEVTAAAPLPSFPDLARISLAQPISLQRGNTVGVYVHTADNWGIPFAALKVDGRIPAATAGRRKDPSRNAFSVRDENLRIGLVRCAISHRPFQDLDVDISSGPSVFVGRVEYTTSSGTSTSTGSPVTAQTESNNSEQHYPQKVPVKHPFGGERPTDDNPHKRAR